MRALICLNFIFSVVLCYPQIRLGKLVLADNEKFVIENSDILVVDTLIMHDSSSIILNLSKNDNFIHAKEVVVGANCFIIGRGVDGRQGTRGEKPVTPQAPCRRGLPGTNARNGALGQDAINLSLYANNLTIEGSLIINLNGGDGGDGGQGGEGGDGGSGTKFCVAGDGGKGGNGANGASGGKGGNLNLVCQNCGNLRLLLGQKLIIKNFGGMGGIGGSGGMGGPAGLGPDGDGKRGIKGLNGANASRGKNGITNLSKNY